MFYTREQIDEIGNAIEETLGKFEFITDMEKIDGGKSGSNGCFWFKYGNNLEKKMKITVSCMPKLVLFQWGNDKVDKKNDEEPMYELCRKVKNII